MLTWQLGDRRSQRRIVLSNEPEINVSSTGDMDRDVTLIEKRGKRRQQLLNTDTVNESNVESNETQASLSVVLTFCYGQENSGCICCHEGKGTG